MVEHGLQSETVLGFAFDGTGYGSDDSIWGGEVLLSTTDDFDRVAHLKPFRLPAGDISVRQPWRTALSLIEQACDRESFQQWLREFDVSDQESNIRFATRRGIPSTSMGRLFDAVATMILPIRSSHYEGEPAMMLEAACDQQVTSAYSLDLVGNGPIQMDWHSLIHTISDERSVVAPESIAMKFHRAIAYAVVDVARRFSQYPAVLCGGVFQNRVLLELIDQRAAEFGIEFRFPGRIPTNDGGLAIGQLLVAAAKIQSCKPTSLGDLREVNVECV
jgi:hydrogenase maturation protein HypF